MPPIKESTTGGDVPMGQCSPEAFIPVPGSLTRELTFGEKAVGITFNPSQDTGVSTLKRYFAQIIDDLNSLRSDPRTTPEQSRLYSIAITEAQGAQMWAVKAITWK